jgi:hypothetical protein
MIYLPWVAFGLAVWWMIHQGDKARKEYLRRKSDDKERAKLVVLVNNVTDAMGSQTSPQGRSLETATAYGFGGGSSQGQGRATKWN